MKALFHQGDVMSLTPASNIILPSGILQAGMRDAIRSLIESFFQKVDDIQYHNCDNDVVRKILLQKLVIKTGKKLNLLNEDFRELFLHIKRKNKKNSLYVLKLNHFDLKKRIEWICNFKFRFSKNKEDKIKIKKPVFTSDWLRQAMEIEITLLFKKYEVVYLFQIHAAFLKLLLEFFDPDTFQLKTLQDIFSSLTIQFVENLDIVEAQNNLYLNVGPDLPKRKKKIIYPTREKYFELMAKNNCGPFQLQKLLVAELGVSLSSIRRDMKEKGVVNLKTESEPTPTKISTPSLKLKTTRGMKGKRYNKKSDCVDLVEVRLLLNHHDTATVKKMIVERYGVSLSTARRIVLQIQQQINLSEG